VERLAGRWLLPAAAVLVFIRYPAGLADWMSAEPTAEDYLAGPTFGWTIALLDLGVALPATVAVCVGYRRAAETARRGLYAILGWYALVGAAVAAMAVAMQLRDDPAMTVGQMASMSILGALLVALAVATYAALVRSGRLSRRRESHGRGGRRPRWRSATVRGGRLRRLAPSSHNTQPWIFRVDGGRLDVLADRSRALPVNDPHDRELTISVAAAVFNARVAVEHAGRQLDVEVLPDPDEPDLLARGTLMGAAPTGDAALFAAIRDRRTYRKPFAARPVPQGVLNDLIGAAAAEARA
jgi:hypothetical protein